MSKLKVEIRKLKARIQVFEAEALESRGALTAAELKVKSYGEQIERVRGAHLIKQLEEAGIKYVIHSCRWQVALPGGILEVESLPAAINAIRENAAPPGVAAENSSLNPAQDADQ